MLFARSDPPPDSAERILQGGRCVNPLLASPDPQHPRAHKHQETKNSQSLWHFIVYKTKAPVARTQSFCLQQRIRRGQSLALKYLKTPDYVNMPPLGPQATAEAPALASERPPLGDCPKSALPNFVSVFLRSRSPNVSAVCQGGGAGSPAGKVGRGQAGRSRVLERCVRHRHQRFPFPRRVSREQCREEGALAGVLPHGGASL